MEDKGDKQQKGSLYIMFVDENTLSLLDMALTHMSWPGQFTCKTAGC